ncbi:uncharacterized protein HMPREF1541_02569 [Cyphellophora europaea CBS 101466]|uniref:Glycosyltransferase family 17 protein n=1 Tax=Cyphellophora europaea (strain CBS 101466) TaxID=1220924 RepID=W2S4A2_CYPE1|nr:uncharacterized protein HMPREF1541_02569 [Cyphellophora europaea CBS 101466]ETN43410.1 hypothetical protein HMPREF1541_02569 [Cyphellophora europaea CBS 101466]
MLPRRRLFSFVVTALVICVFCATYDRHAVSTSLRTTTEQAAPDDEASRICKRHRFQPFLNPGARKVYDLFMIDTELDLLEIRLNTLDSVVDYFVIIESAQSFTKVAKPLYVSENLGRFDKFKDKIILHVIDFTNFGNTSEWELESYSRNALYTEVFPTLKDSQRPTHGDVILLSDIDEIPKPETITFLKACQFPERTTIESNFYYYSFQWKHDGKRWLHPQATFFQGDRTILPQDLRGSAGAQSRVIYDGAWHCSSCFSTVAEVQKKLESFSHQEFNQPVFKDPAQIVRRFRNGVDIAERPLEKYSRIENNRDLPSYLKDNPGKFPWFISRDAPNANFLDFEGEGAKSLEEWVGPTPVVWPQ